MPKLYPGKPYYNFFEVRDEVNKLLERDIDNYAGKTYNEKGINIPYLNFWHNWLDFNGGVFQGNDSFIVCSFEAMKEYFQKEQPEKVWIVEICDAFIKVMNGCEECSDKGYYNFWVSW